MGNEMWGMGRLSHSILSRIYHLSPSKDGLGDVDQGQVARVEAAL